MKIFALLILLVSFYCCKTDAGKSPINVNEKLLKTNDLGIGHDDFLLNGKCKTLSLEQNLFAILGKPDKIEQINYDTVCVSYWFGKTEKESSEKYYRYKNTIFETYKDSIVLTELDFRSNPNLFLSYKDHKIDKDLTLENFLKIFPNSPVLPNQIVKIADGDDEWAFYFEKNKLVKIEYLMSC